MKNSMGEKIQTYRETKKDGNRTVGFKPITGGKYKCTEKGCTAKVTKKGIDGHDNTHNTRDNSAKVISRFTSKVNSLITTITSLTAGIPMYRQRSVLSENGIGREISKLEESVSKHSGNVREELDKILRRVKPLY